MVTSRDVAKVAGVSQATVSRVLNGNGRVAPENRAKVLAALERTGYVPNASAKAMRTKTAGAIGVVTSEIQNPFLPYLLDALTSAASARGTTMIVWNDPDPGAPSALAGVGSGAVDGVLFTAATQGSPGAHELIQRGVPVLLCNRAPTDAAADVVMSDHYASGAASAEYLVRHGRREIAAIFGPASTFASPARQAGFRDALEAAGVRLVEHRVVDGPTSYESGFLAAQRLFDAASGVDAVFCSSDIIAYGAIDAFRTLGVTVPDDVWVCGIDGLPMSSWSAFGLTTHAQQVATIADRALDLLLARVGGATGEPEHVLVPTVLEPRASTEFAT